MMEHFLKGSHENKQNAQQLTNKAGQVTDSQIKKNAKCGKCSSAVNHIHCMYEGLGSRPGTHHRYHHHQNNLLVNIINDVYDIRVL